MKEENLAIANVGEPTVRMTRARAAACHAFGGISPSEALKQQGQKQVLRTSPKRAALDEMNSSASAAAPLPEALPTQETSISSRFSAPAPAPAPASCNLVLYPCWLSL